MLVGRRERAAGAPERRRQTRIQSYLERGGRALAKDFVNVYTPDQQRAWGYFFDKVRAEYGNDVSWRGGACVTYRHFIVSPDPRDRVDLDTLRAVATEWVHELFGDGFEPGRLGSYQVAIIYHDDNAHKIPHAHVIVNNTELETGRRLSISAKDNRKTLPGTLNRIAKERGLSYFSEDGYVRAGEGATRGKLKRYYTKEERGPISAGKFCWKEDLANHIDVAARTASNMGEFLAELDLLGVRVEEKDGDFVYRHPSNPGVWSARGVRIGNGYSKSGIESYFDELLLKPTQTPARRSELRERVNDYIDRETQPPQSLDSTEIETRSESASRDVPESVTQRAEVIGDVANAVTASEAHEIKNVGELNYRARKYLEITEHPLNEEQMAWAKKEIEAIKRARKTLREGGFLIAPNVGAMPQRRRASSRVAGEAAPRAGARGSSGASRGAASRSQKSRQVTKGKPRGRSR